MKSAHKIFLSVILIFSIFSCKKEDSAVTAEKNERAQTLFVKLNYYLLTGESDLRNPASFYQTEAMHSFARRKYLEADSDGSRIVRPALEILAENTGIIESYGFYDEYGETADWVDSVIVQVEEERIASQIESLEENMEEAVAEEFEIIPQIDPEFDADKPSNEMQDKDDMLAFAEYEKEKFVVTQNEEGKILIYASNGLVSRLFYDDLLRLKKEETWLIKSSESAELQKSAVYEYAENSYSLKSKLVESGTTEERFSYTDEGLVSKKETFVITENDKKITSRQERVYDQEQNVITEILTEYFYTDKSYSKLDYEFEKRYDYSYNEDEIPPDYKYYENGILKMQNKYSSEKGTYTSQIFFDGSYSVKTYYEDGRRVREVFFMDGAVRRERNYE